MQDIFHTDVDETVPLKDYTAEQLKSLEGSKRSDTDPGPAEAWHHAHLELNWPAFVCSYEVHDLRRWGYVMWDYSRLVEMGFFDSPVIHLVGLWSGHARSSSTRSHCGIVGDAAEALLEGGQRMVGGG